ncbi:carboxypeptidase regulatory-like domain-containing protein [Nocardioides anomalus]|uniref:Carboxypeptidase regulatory-like domain-containing protein n=1 Tax=Nocardioides anomalus TaxID=2712223 RepID=A0A6G6W9T4_9ACTN|nr:carboxypeptidase-like regulatory domain-containing protein [Nocardioides anomalus]QIG41800.1 carboxypeptidase regulatory-like domain-containing protein [Nocardioides anomalus]
MDPSRRTRALALLTLLLALLAPALVALGSAPAEAATGRVRGTITGAHGDTNPKVKVSWFTEDWTYLGARKARGGGYSLVLEPGTYHLQFTDQRPAYDVEKYYPADVTVTVSSGATAIKNVRLRTGAAIGGVVTAGGKPAGGARIVAANKEQNSFETTANKQGEYALGGLPPGSYSIFTYDRRKQFVGKSTYLPRMKAGTFKKTNVKLTTKAGRFVVDLYAGDQPYPDVAFVTAVSKSNGQFWTEKAAHGSVTFSGLYPGKYTLVIPGAGGYLGGTLPVTGKVKKGRTSFGTLRLTRPGASVGGAVVDSKDASKPLSPVAVSLYDGTGALVASGTTAADGTFTVGGQLDTASGLTLVAQPSGGTAPYLRGAAYCKFGTTTIPGISVTAGQVTPLGVLSLPHLAGADQDASCQP